MHEHISNMSHPWHILNRKKENHKNLLAAIVERSAVIMSLQQSAPLSTGVLCHRQQQQAALSVCVCVCLWWLDTLLWLIHAPHWIWYNFLWVKKITTHHQIKNIKCIILLTSIHCNGTWNTITLPIYFFALWCCSICSRDDGELYDTLTQLPFSNSMMKSWHAQIWACVIGCSISIIFKVNLPVIAQVHIFHGHISTFGNKFSNSADTFLGLDLLSSEGINCWGQIKVRVIFFFNLKNIMKWHSQWLT